MSDQPPLFDMAGEPKPTWARYQAERRTCDKCRQRLHTLGVARASFPSPARWIRTSAGVDSYLCQNCALEVRAQDRQQ